MQNSEIYKQYDEYSVVKFIELGILSWPGRVIRLEESGPAKKLFFTYKTKRKWRR